NRCNYILAKHDTNPNFFCQAEDGIRDFHVTGVQTCALPIFTWSGHFFGLRILWRWKRGSPRRSGTDCNELLTHPLPSQEAHTVRSEEHTSELQSRENLVCRLLLEKKKTSAVPRASCVCCLYG